MDNVYKRMSAVMEEIPYLRRDSDQGEYWILTDESATSAVRAALIKYGLLMYPITIHREHGVYADVDITYRVQSIDDPEDYAIVASTGSGDSLGAAMTNAHKYALLQTFNIPHGMEDKPEAKSPRQNALLKSIYTMCKDKDIIDQACRNMYQKDVTELTADELQKLASAIDKLLA